jgi:hypothetical protein
MTRHLVALAAFLAQAHPQPPVLYIDVVDPHGQGGAHPRERKHHQRDQRPIAQAHRRCHIDTVQELPRLARLEHRRLALARAVARPAHRGGGIHRHDLAGHQPVEQMPDRGQALLTVGADSVCVCSSIQLAMCNGCTAVIDATPACAHQARNSPTARTYARRVCGLRIADAKKSRKRTPARSPAVMTSVGNVVPARLLPAGARALARALAPVPAPLPRRARRRPPTRRAAVLRRAHAVGRAGCLCPVACAAACLRVGGVCQASLRGTESGARVPVTLYAPRRHLQPAPGRLRRTWRHLPLEGLPHEGAAHATKP